VRLRLVLARHAHVSMGTGLSSHTNPAEHGSCDSVRKRGPLPGFLAGIGYRVDHLRRRLVANQPICDTEP
jgi:hypothetical protein